MITWKEAYYRGLLSGSLAAVTSAVALVACGKFEKNAPVAPLNGPSQWVWGERSAHRRRASWRTVVGYSIHHFAAMGWGVFHEKCVAPWTAGQPFSRRMLGAAATSAVAFTADYGIAKGRMQPGFEKHLGGVSLFVVYSAFALGLAILDSHARPARSSTAHSAGKRSRPD
jgi:hypothetical protein